MTRTCPECDTELVDINDNHGIHYDYPYYVCPNKECQKSPYYRQEQNEEILTTVLGEEPYQEDTKTVK